MVGANGSALPIYEHEQPQRLTDHNPHQIDREIEHHQSLNDYHSLKVDRENEQGREAPLPISKPQRRTRSALPSRGPKPLLPRSLKEALQLASLLSKSKLVPKGFENPEACLVGILYGMEVGLSPIAALQRMAIIDGRPTIWGDAALALVQASGLLVSILEDIIESEIHKNSTPHFSAICTVKREGRSDPVTRSFSIEDAKRASLWQKPGPWTDYPDRMLMMRARAFALRDAFPDVLMGLYIREEFEGSNNQGSINHQDKMQSNWDQNTINQDKIQSDWDDASPSQTGGKEGDINTISTAGSSNGDHRASDSNDREGVWHSYQTRDGRDPKLDRSNTIEHSRRRAPPPPPIEVEPEVPSIPEKQSTTTIEGLENNGNLPDLTASEEVARYQSASVTLELFDSALACAKDEETLEEIREEFNQRIDRLDSGSLQEAGRIFLRYEKRIRATEEAFKTRSDPSDTSLAQHPSIGSSEIDKSEDRPSELEEKLEECESGLFENATGRIGKEALSSHRRRRITKRTRRGLTLAELNARRKVDLLKYLPNSTANEGKADED
jgi:hypothetical protein